MNWVGGWTSNLKRSVTFVWWNLEPSDNQAVTVFECKDVCPLRRCFILVWDWHLKQSSMNFVSRILIFGNIATSSREPAFNKKIEIECEKFFPDICHPIQF